MKRNFHHRRVLAAVELLFGATGGVHAERAIPAADRRIDALFEVGEPSDGWGVLRGVLAHRTVVLEHFSRPPGAGALARCFAKLSWIVDEYWNHSPALGRRVPLLLVISEGKPRTALGAWSAVRPGEVRGIWQQEDALRGDVVLADLRGLPLDTPGTSVLRLFRVHESQRESEAAIRALRDDPAVLPSTKEMFMEAIVDGRIPASEPERRSILQTTRDRAWARGLKKGLAKGREEGRLEGERAALLSMAERLLGHETARELATLDSVDAIQERLALLLGQNR